MKPGQKIGFTLKTGVHFQRFIIKHRNTEDIEEVKEVLNAFEKDALLLKLISIAFDVWKHKSILIVCLWTGKTLSALSGTLFLFPLDITEF